MTDPAPDTVTDALALLREQGYTVDFDLRDGQLVAGSDTPVCAVATAAVERIYRFEGPSDPGDEMVVFALRDPATGARGTLASAFGLNADPALVDHLVDLRRRGPAD